MVLGKRLGSNTTTYAVCAEFPGCAAGAPIAQGATTKLGMNYSGTIKVESSAADYTAECLRIKEEGVDYVMLGLPSATGMRFISSCQTQDYEGRWGMTDGAIEPKAMIENDPDVTINLGLTAFPWFADEPPAEAYRTMMEEQGVPDSTWGDPHGTAAYAAAELLKKTLDTRASSLPEHLTREDVIEAYGTVENETLDGLLPQPITFHPNKPNALVNCYWLATFANGEFGGANLAKPVCDPPSLQG
jgi:branched-chain amino acid transport system substrate-binding protein